MSNDIRVVISGDGGPLEAEIKGLREQLSSLNRAASSGGPAGPIDRGMQGAARSTRAASEQMRNLSYQITDIATGLATGQNPFFVLIQQGGQIKDIFGGVIPALKVIGSLLTVTRVAMGGLAAVGGLLAVSFYQGNQEAKELATALRLAGNAADVTKGKYQQLVTSAAERNRLPVGDVRESAAALISGTEFRGNQFAPALEALTAYRKASGANAEDSAKVFSGMTRDVTAWATEANRAYHFVTRAQLDQIRELQAQHKVTEATDLVLKLFAENMATKAAPATSTWARAVEYASIKFSKWYADIKAKAGDETLEARIERLRTVIGNLSSAGDGKGVEMYGVGGRLAAARAELDAAMEEQRLAARSRTKSAADQKAEEDAIAADSAERQSARIAAAQSAIALRSQLEINSLNRIQQANERAYDLGLESFDAYQTTLTNTQLREIASREAAAKAEAAAIASRKGLSPEAREQAANDLARQLAQLKGERDRVKAGDASARDAQAARVEVNNYTKPLDDVERQLGDRFARIDDMALEARRNLAIEVQSINADLIRDDRARAEAQFAIERERVERSLQLNTRFGEDKKAAQQALDDWSTARQRQLNEQLKPEWMKSLEDWRDIERLKRDATNESLNGIVRNTEGAFVQLVTTGRISLKTLVNDFIATQARLAFRKFAGSVFSRGGGNLFSSFASAIGSFFGAGRAMGGDVGRGTLHPINETGAAEVLTAGGRDYLMMGASSGRVTRAATGSTIAVSMPLTMHIDARSDQAQIAAIASGAVQEGQRQMFQQLRQARVLA